MAEDDSEDSHHKSRIDAVQTGTGPMCEPMLTASASGVDGNWTEEMERSEGQGPELDEPKRN